MTLLPLAAAARPVVRVVHPSGTLVRDMDALERGLGRLELAGCEVRWDASRAKAMHRDIFAGDDATRAAEFVSALEEPGVDIVWFARGGSGAGRILGPIVEAARRLPPRLVVGFSDATAILNALHDHAGWLTWHGPGVTTIGTQPRAHFDLEAALELLRGDRDRVTFRPCREGTLTRGVVRGGNLTVLASLVGTPFGPLPSPNALWFLEDVNEAPYRLDRAFTQLRQSGALEGCLALWIGDLSLPSCQTKTATDGFVEDALVPVLPNAPAGHKGRVELLPIGGAAVFDPRGGHLVAVDRWVERPVG